MKYNPAAHHEPLFSEPNPAQGGGSEMTKKNRSLPSVARGKCPECAAFSTVGLVRQNGHLVWRLHTRATMSGAHLECRASGVTLCQAPARPINGVTTPTCVCEGPA